MVERRQDEPTQIRGVRTREESSVRTYVAGRVCLEFACGTVLSVYNSSAFCWQHERPRPGFGVPPGRPRRDRRLEEVSEGIWAFPA
jgi:hypothetical protein